MALIYFQQKIHPQNALTFEARAAFPLIASAIEKYLSRLSGGALHPQSPIQALTSSVFDVLPLIHRRGVSTVRILARQGDEVFSQRALPTYLDSNTSNVIGARDNVRRENAFQNKARSCQSPPILQWPSVTCEIHSKLLGKTQSLFTFCPLLIFTASFPGLSLTCRPILYWSHSTMQFSTALCLKGFTHAISSAWKAKPSPELPPYWLSKVLWSL